MEATVEFKTLYGKIDDVIPLLAQHYSIGWLIINMTTAFVQETCSEGIIMRPCIIVILRRYV